MWDEEHVIGQIDLFVRVEMFLYLYNIKSNGQAPNHLKKKKKEHSKSNFILYE